MIRSVYRLKFSNHLLNDFRKEVINFDNIKIIKFEKTLFDDWELIVDYPDPFNCMLFEGIIYKYKITYNNLMESYMKNNITKEKFMAYERVRREGKYNMIME